jgi:hypothetical protein
MLKKIFKKNLIVLVLITFIISPMVFSGCSLFQKRYSKSITKEYTLNPKGKKKLCFDNVNGNIIVKKSLDSLINIKVEYTFKVRKRDLDKEVEDSKIKIDSLTENITITLESKTNGFRFFNFDFNDGEKKICWVYLPDGIDVDISNVNSKIEISDVNNKIDADITNGKAELKNTTGKLNINITNGDITCSVDSTAGLNFDVTNGKCVLNAGENLSGNFELNVRNGKIVNEWKENLLTGNAKLMHGKVGISNSDIKMSVTNGGIKLFKK